MAVVLEDTKDATLSGLALFERHQCGHTGSVWNYPSLSKALEKLVLARTKLAEIEPPELPITSFSKHRDRWVYVHLRAGTGGVAVVGLVLFTTVFNPEKYLALLALIAPLHASPVELLRRYLDVYTKAQCSVEKSKFDSRLYDASKDHLLSGSLLEITREYKDSIWLIWSAMLMKKRVFVLASDVAALERITRSLPLMVLHRMDWSLLRPHVTLSNEELDDLRSAGVYVAGTLDEKIRQQEHLYDLLIDCGRNGVSVATHAEDDFKETRFHSDLAAFMQKVIETEGIDNAKMIKAFKVKTGELLAKLASLKQADNEGRNVISFNHLASLKLPPHTDAFLYGVASAEGMTKSAASAQN